MSLTWKYDRTFCATGLMVWTLLPFVQKAIFMACIADHAD